MERKEVGDYIIDRTISSYDRKIKHGIHKKSGNQVIIRVYDKHSFDSNIDKYIEIRQNLAIFSLLDHPHILKLIEVFETSRELYVVVEYASNGDMLDFLIQKEKLSVQESLKFFRELIYGLDYLQNHHHQVYYDTLSLDHILLDEFEHVKLNIFNSRQLNKPNPLEENDSWPNYASPELIRGQASSQDPESQIVWACGVILYTFLTGRYPFDDHRINVLMRKIVNGKFDMPDLPECVQDLISRMLTTSISERITMDEIKNHPAFLIGLPDGYVVPSPLQFKLFKEGIDPSIVDPKIRQIIKNLGYNNDDEINVELASPGYTPSKVFYLMLNKSAAYKLLQWEESGQSKSAEFFLPLMRNDAPGTESLKNELLDTFESSPIHYLIQMPIVHFEYEKVFDGIAIELQRLMKGLQSFLTENCFKWFHQSDMELISKSLNSSLLVLISCSFQTTETIILKILLIQGSQDEVVQLAQKIRNCISFLSSGCTGVYKMSII